MYIKQCHETSLHRHYLTRGILEPNREFNRRGRGGTRGQLKLRVLCGYFCDFLIFLGGL